MGLLDNMKAKLGPAKDKVSDLARQHGDKVQHFWPWNSKAPRVIAVVSTAGSADGWATMKSLPPVSPTSRG
ncbi:hypothetical protein [Streptomyces tricolor]